MTKTLALRGLLAAFLLALGASAGSAVAEEQKNGKDGMSAEQFVASLHFQDGHIEVPQAKVHFDLNHDFRYLGKDDARQVLETYWGNPPDDSMLGMIVPRQPALDEQGSWAVVVTYADDGYVSDEDASKIDYKNMLADMQKQTREENTPRKEAGYESVDLLGWAVPPRYDAATKKLYWARELAFQGSPGHTLNYDIRLLGRHGYLSLNAIAGMDALPQVRAGMQQLLPMAEFDSGARYADHNPSTDKIASYGLATLIGGGLAAKAGLFAKLGLLLAKAWKLVALGGMALVGGIGKLFSGRKRDGGTVR
ncbi:DUF2167 domain-containing protein [Xanthomonas translucens]|uniref:DUF2167 domain-containing protein n=2 Tax=Xanthomonas campestris pv. translucens TaxID=343 RepID=UPI00071E939F|nr:DUF2167 domain-containing protein [Xanthomonas translucens]KTF40417.1 membrane protein [Xanthomonas translucens pv. translucens]MCT8274547.1 DUF2167 domain-containing protein [Xanthomonas translucens pv. translucens]MCT8278458.1 DUF2167 domain-containing protein [Xanthomonas translucens pv. translucens]MCT8307446.1 DUF2167 domain-containing protein [Xanthomonas translucens pv. translucens]